VLKHLIQAGLDGESIEDSFVYLCRAFDGLCEHFGTKQQYLMKELEESYQSVVRQALQNAANQIESCSAVALAASQPAQSRVLKTIVDRTLNAANVDQNFGLAVTALLKKFSLPDADIIDAYYQKKPRPDGRPTWAAVLSHYRGAPTHTGYFNFSGKEHDAGDILDVEDHLRDILLRIIFKIVGYDGTYQPPVIRWTTDAETDWVKADTTASNLGYK
jgi:hypothetical protein